MYAADRKVQGLSALASGAVVFCLGAALILGLGVGRLAASAQNLAAVVFSTEPPPPPPPPEIERPRPKAEKAAATGDPAPRNLKNRATQIVAPPMPVILKPPPVVTAPVANVGDAASNGASDLPGPGQGAGGFGSGFGGGGEGGFGDGRGGGRREPAVEPPRHVRGRLGYRDAPEGMVPEGREGHVGVIFAVEPDGRVSDCEIERSSGIRALDGLVCSLIRQRFVFRPARDRFGRPVRSRVAETHSFFGRPEGG